MVAADMAKQQHARLYLAARDGVRMPSMGEPNGAGEDIAGLLTDAQAEDELIAQIEDLRGRVDPDGDLRAELTTLLGRLERRRARRPQAPRKRPR